MGIRRLGAACLAFVRAYLRATPKFVAGPQVLALHKDACPAWIDVCFEIPDALPEGRWRKNKAAYDQRGTKQDEFAFHNLPIPTPAKHSGPLPRPFYVFRRLSRRFELRPPQLYLTKGR